jgi:hypothetical protein
MRGVGVNELRVCAWRRERGQAIVEFVAASGLLVTLMLSIMLIGRYHDLQASVIQSARYAAFERATGGAIASDVAIRDQMRARLFTWTNDPLRTADALRDGDRWRSENVNWTDHTRRRNRFIEEPRNIALQTSQRRPPGRAGGATAQIVNVIDRAARVTGTRFDVNSNGFYTATSTAQIANLSYMPAPLNRLNIRFTESVSILGDGWNAGGPGDVARRAGALVPSRVFSVLTTDLRPVRDVLSWIEPAFDEFCPGIIDPEIVPVDRLDRPGSGPRGSWRPRC